MKEQMLYKEFGKYYDLIYHWKDYRKEVIEIKKLIKKYKKTQGKDLIDIGCGTGHHLKYLKEDFNCIGTDINEEILQVAREKLNDVVFEKADMITMNLGKKFDVVLSLFSAIGYVKTHDNLRKTIQNFSNHLKPGGVLIIEPWFTPDKFTSGFPYMVTYENEDIKIARSNVSKREGNISILEFHYLIAERDKDVKHFIDKHELGLFEIEEILKYLKESGIEAEYLEKGFMEDRGIYVGVKT